ncbi:hypothetical protein GALL_538440 [mine drainage metagenome]|uniref:Uncharacterized protein n=1 Tax=mine drainage metagenome TaxID=410659 RepID=A0A1J5PH55_9ZZZZ
MVEWLQHLDIAPRDLARALLVARIQCRLAAARLAHRDVNPASRLLQQLDRRKTDRWAHRVHKAGRE